MNDTPMSPVQAPVATRPSNNMLQTAGAQALVQRTLAEVQVAVLMAKQFPRDKIEAKESLLNDCCREDLAKVAMYSYSRGGTEITGPSIRLAEAAKNAWGNMQSGWRELSRTPASGSTPGQSEVEAFAWDTERNTRESLTFMVKHWRDTKQGGYALKDERDIYELCANQAARRERACILKMIDGDLIEAAITQCHATLNSKIQVTPERIGSMVKMFEDLGITKAQMEKRVQRRIDTINGPIMVSLTKIFNSIRDGMSKAEDWFEPEEKPDGGDKKSGAEALKEKLKQDKAKGPDADPVTGEIIDQGADKPKSEAADVPLVPAIRMPTMPDNTAEPDIEGWALQWNAAVEMAPNAEWLRDLRKKNATVLGSFTKRNPDKHAECVKAYDDKLAALSGKA